MPMLAAPFGHGLESPLQALLHRLDVHRELPSQAARTQVSETQEVEGCRFSPRPFRLRESLAPKLHKTGLFRMEHQPELREPLG